MQTQTQNIGMMKTHKLIFKNAEAKPERVLLTESQYKQILYAIQARQVFITIPEIETTFKRTNILEINKLKNSERHRLFSGEPVVIGEEFSWNGNTVERYQGATVWVEVRSQGTQILSRRRLYYKPCPDEKYQKIYL